MLATALAHPTVFVRDLDRSKEFYGQLLELDVAVTTGEALLLSAGDGDHPDCIFHRRRFRCARPAAKCLRCW